MNERVQNLLDELANYTAQEIAEKLAADGLLWCHPFYRSQGCVELGWHCPLAKWLKKRLGKTGGVTVGAGGLNIDGDLYQLPQSAREFVYGFDNGDFSDIENAPPVGELRQIGETKWIVEDS